MQRLFCTQTPTGVLFYKLDDHRRQGDEENNADDAEKLPGLTICGMHDGYFKDDAPVIAAINEAKPDVLFVCLGAPKQELFMKRHQNDLSCRLMIGLGGSLDSFAGTVKRAPKWMIKANLEWLYRLYKEPKRFGRMLRLPKYLWAVVCRRIRG